MRNRASAEQVAFILVIIGGINWGLIGLFQYNLVGEIFGAATGLSRLIYILVGAAAVYLLYLKYGVRKV